MVLELSGDSAAEAVGYEEGHTLLEAGAVFNEFSDNCFGVSAELGGSVHSGLWGWPAIAVGPSGCCEEEGELFVGGEAGSAFGILLEGFHRAVGDVEGWDGH